MQSTPATVRPQRSAFHIPGRFSSATSYNERTARKKIASAIYYSISVCARSRCGCVFMEQQICIMATQISLHRRSTHQTFPRSPRTGAVALYYCFPTFCLFSFLLSSFFIGRHASCTRDRSQLNGVRVCTVARNLFKYLIASILQQPITIRYIAAELLFPNEMRREKKKIEKMKRKLHEEWQ